MRDGVILLNAGHLPHEIDATGLAADPRVGPEEAGRTVSRRFALQDGRRVHLLTGGHMVNLAGPRPMGNSIESMDLVSPCRPAVWRQSLRARSMPGIASCRYARHRRRGG